MDDVPAAVRNGILALVVAVALTVLCIWSLEHIAVFVDRVSENQTKVEVVSKKAMAMNIFAPDWAPEILQRLDQALR